MLAEFLTTIGAVTVILTLFMFGLYKARYKATHSQNCSATCRGTHGGCHCGLEN